MNSNNKILIASVMVAFIMGVLSTYLYMTKQQMDVLLQGGKLNSNSKPIKQSSNGLSNNRDDFISLDNPTLVDQNNQGLDAKTANTSQTVSTSDYTEEQAKAIINNMPDVVLEQYVDKFMTHDASQVIADKRRFAERAVEELYQPNDSRPLNGEIRLSFNSTMPAQSIDVSTIDKFAKVYAHLDTGGRVPARPYVFIKWVNNQTGQVLLFEKKDVVENRNQNWVSFRPYEGWKVGSYDIRFYQFTSELEPIAQLTYNIYSVTDTSEGGEGEGLSSTIGSMASLN